MDQHELVERLLDVEWKELQASLRSVDDSALLPPGYRNFATGTKQLALEKLVGGLGADRRHRLGRAFGMGASDQPSAHQPASRPDSHLQTHGSVAAGSSPPAAAGAGRDPDGPIFVVHGRDDASRHQLVRVLERATHRAVIVLHEQTNRGATLIEKFEREATAASFAVVLLTGDDVGGLPGEEPRPRARQNVVFELGYFVGKLGRPFVTVLRSSGVEKPSDINGLVYIDLDGSGAWVQPLMRELVAAEIEVDWPNLP